MESWPPSVSATEPPQTDACPTPYFVAESEAEQLLITPLLTLIIQALLAISSATEDADGHQHFDRPIAALIVAYAHLPSHLYHCRCSPKPWTATELQSPSQLPPAPFVELLHHRLRHPSLSATDCPSVECQARLWALTTDDPQPELPAAFRRIPAWPRVWGPHDAWVEGCQVLGDDDTPLSLQPPFLLLFFYSQHHPQINLTFAHYYPSLADLRAELLLHRDVDPYHDSPRQVHAKQRAHAEEEGEQLPVEWTTDPVDAAWHSDRNADTLRLLRKKLRTGHVSLAFHCARYL